jgi:ATP-binding cassette subfamily B protein/subfamily B ATP-binding cassette protein MsbA
MKRFNEEVACDILAMSTVLNIILISVCWNESNAVNPVKLVLQFARKYKLAMGLACISSLLLVGAQLLVPWVIKILIDSVTNPSPTQSIDFITQLAILVLVVYVVKGVLQFLQSYMSHVAGWSVVADSRKFIYEHVQRLSLRFYEDKQTGQLMSRVVNDTDLFETLISHAVPDIIVNILTFVGVSAVLLTINWKLTLLSMIPIPLVLLSLKVYARYVRPAFVNRQKDLGKLNAVLNDCFSGIREIKAFTREDEELIRVGAGIDSYRDSQMSALRLMAIFAPFIEFTSSLGTLIVIYFGGRMAFTGRLPIADLVAFYLYLDLFYQPVKRISNAWEQIQNAMAGADRVADLLSEEPEVQDASHALTLKERSQGHIEFRNVGFGYIEDEPVLEGIDLDIPSQSVVALVGPTGVGKSTLVSLIPRFYEVCHGSIALDGRDIDTLTLDSLRKQISIVLQDVFLFHGTVRENILFGRPNATEDEMIEAAKVANAHEFILNLPDGYDTMIGERGVKLSGGQKQRLSIARAVLKDAPILILDEATSSVDTETELQIQDALERLMVGKTTIIIAHRLSTVRNADQIVVLEGRRVVEKGTHEQLIEKNGLYKRLYSVQKRIEPVGEIHLN